jgi:hypothetical protein
LRLVAKPDVSRTHGSEQRRHGKVSGKRLSRISLPNQSVFEKNSGTEPGQLRSLLINRANLSHSPGKIITNHGSITMNFHDSQIGFRTPEKSRRQKAPSPPPLGERLYRVGSNGLPNKIVLFLPRHFQKQSSLTLSDPP